MLNNALIPQQGSNLSTPSFVPLAGQLQFIVYDSNVVYRSIDYGLTWTSAVVSATGFVGKISCSTTGKYVLTSANGRILVSSDYGASYTTNLRTGLFRDNAISASGQYQYVGRYSSNVFATSTDYGVTWSSATISSISEIYVTSTDGTGQYVIISNGGDTTLESYNYGITFSAMSGIPSQGAISATLSSTGQYQFVFINGYGVYRSSDYGSSWSLILSNAVVDGVYSMSCSSTGQYVMICGYARNIFQSSDYGTNFTDSGYGYSRGFGCAMDYNGVHRLATGEGADKWWVSSDSGVTYTRRGVVLSTYTTGAAMNKTNA